MNKKITVKGSLQRFRDFIYIDDVVESWYRASFYEEIINETINLGTGQKTTVLQILEILKSMIKVNDIKTEESTPCDQLGIYADNTKLNNLLKITRYVNLKDGLAEFLFWANQNSTK